MIQRIQSVYLFLAAIVSMGLLFLLPTFTVNGELIMATSDPTYLTLFIVSAALSIFTLTRFKNRKLQVAMGRLNVILNFILFGIILTSYFMHYKDNGGSLGLAMIIPIITIVFTSLANRAIMGDEELVRAADRLR